MSDDLIARAENATPRVWNPFAATAKDSPFEYDQGDVVLIAYDDLYDLVHHRDDMSDRKAAQGAGDTAPTQHALAPCGHVLAATYGTAGCQLPICAGDRETAMQRERRCG